MYSWIVASTFLFPNSPLRRHIPSNHSPPFCSHQNVRCLARPAITTCSRSHPQMNIISTIIEDKSRKVEILPLEVVQRIAAGEVIAGYDSVVQELVENSIDANAKVVKVDIDLATSSIIVQDDGTGISREQGLADIARCNATSKLRTLAELSEGISTLGFRGQALWAIAMTATRLQICSRTSASPCGVCVVFTSDGSSREDSIVPVAMAPGTTVTVTGLPWSTEPMEARKVIKLCKDWLLRVALCYPRLNFHLTRNGKSMWRCVAKGGSEEDARIRLLAHELKLHPSDFRTASKLVPGVCEVSAVVGIPSTVHTSSKSWMMTAVNGRCVEIRGIRRAIRSGLDVRKGRYPVAFVNITTEAELVNWNILPMKTKIRFNALSAEEKIVAAIPSLLREALHGTILHDMGEPDTDDTASFVVDEGLRGGMRGVISLLSDKVSPSNVSNSNRMRNGNESTDENEGLPMWMVQARVVAQLLNTYILIEHEGGIMLIEQHVADERGLYERLLQCWRNTRFVDLKEPLKLPENIRAEWIFTLTTLGLISCRDADDTNKHIYEIAAIPEIMSSIPKSNLLSLLLQVCREGSTIEAASASVACRLAVKNGTPLNLREMKDIVRNLIQCDNAFTCPHGRPIFMELQTKELARLFGRSWTPERANNGDTRRTVLRKQGVLPE